LSPFVISSRIFDRSIQRFEWQFDSRDLSMMANSKLRKAKFHEAILCRLNLPQ